MAYSDNSAKHWSYKFIQEGGSDEKESENTMHWAVSETLTDGELKDLIIVCFTK